MHRYVTHLTLSFPPASLETWMRDLMVARHHGRAATAARTVLIASRVRTVAILLALLSAAWIVVDALTLGRDAFIYLAMSRITLVLALVSLAMRCSRHSTLRHALSTLAAARVSLLLFYVFAIMVLDRGAGNTSAFALTTYIYLPFVVAATMGIFPLTLAESLTMILPSLLTLAAIVAFSNGVFATAFGFGAVWLLALIACVATLSGMSQLRFMIELVEQASRDTLTGAYTRRFGEEMLAAQFQIARRHSHNLSIAFFDLDSFKAINDVHGHEAGDAVLRDAAAAIRATIRQQDMLIRWGGEEFLVLLPETSGADARVMVDRVAARGLGRRPDGTPQTASVGIAELDSDSAEAWNLLAAAADRRMYLAKEAGRNRVTDCEHLITSFVHLPATDRAAEAPLPVYRS